MGAFAGGSAAVMITQVCHSRQLARIALYFDEAGEARRNTAELILIGASLCDLFLLLRLVRQGKLQTQAFQKSKTVGVPFAEP